MINFNLINADISKTFSNLYLFSIIISANLNRAVVLLLRSLLALCLATQWQKE